MNLQERENAIGSWLRDVVLPRYNRPDHLGDAEARAEVADMVRDINAEIPVMPADAFGPFLADAFAKVRRAYPGRTWPPIGVFCKAVSSARKESPSTKVEDVPHDEYALTAKRMQASEAVSEVYLYGPKAKELLARNLVSETLMRAYRSVLFFHLRGVYGEDEARRREGELLDLHAAASRPVSEAELTAVRNARFRRMPQVAE